MRPVSTASAADGCSERERPDPVTDLPDQLLAKRDGVPSSQALAATLLYRLAAYWLPLPAGAAAYLLFRRRYPRRAQ